MALIQTIAIWMPEGTAALFASMGYAVKFVSVTNGDAGHQTQGGGALAKRRIAEAQESRQTIWRYL
ncbi:MAG: hypothetical protein U5K54_21290 [Cytophagales bacterium]|nr:hypothetical protein [Cytophagales bacterium]